MSENQEAERETVWLVMMNGISSGFVYTSRQAARDQCSECQEAVAFVPRAAFAAERERADELQRQLAEAQKDVRKWKASFDAQSSDYQRLANEVGDKDDAIERLGDIGRLVGCDHHDYSDGRLQLVNCVEQAIDGLERQIEALTARAEQAEADCAVKTKALSYVKMYGGHGEIEFSEDAGKSVSFFVEKALDVNSGAAILAELRELRAALETIASYDSGNGCCEYGCDTPTIARDALEKGGAK